MLATTMVVQLEKSKALAVLLREGIAIMKWMDYLIPTSSSPSIMIIVSYINDCTYVQTTLNSVFIYRCRITVLSITLLASLFTISY